MTDIINFYMDDSGTRHPDRKIGREPSHGYDYFSLGGILVDEKNEERVRQLYQEFCNNWSIDYPLHSSEIRSHSKNFLWLGKLDENDKLRFYEELYQLMKSSMVIGLACVIDRPGYNTRYRELYGRDRWSLCRTAFGIVVERACKYAIQKDCKLRILPERSSKTDDDFLNSYYQDLKNDGHPFNSDNAAKYSPLSNNEFNHCLYELKFKYKSSPMVQIADLYLWPMSIGGYHKSNRPYQKLLNDRKLIDCHLQDEELKTRGIKYSCFEQVEIKK